jgi:hypothetical protein
MNNTIEACVEFSFKGESYHPCALIDLDELIQNGQDLLNSHFVLAKANGIDTYSYLYETMESYPVSYANPGGLAQQCLDGDIFDFEHFKSLWHNERHMHLITAIAKQHLSIESLENESAIKDALLAAYKAGEKEPKG